MKNNRQNEQIVGSSPEQTGEPIYHQSTYGPAAYNDVLYGDDKIKGVGKGFDLLKLVRILLRRWITVLIFLVVGGLIALLYGLIATPIFNAEAELEMSVRRPKVIDSQVIYDDPSSYGRDDVAIINTRFAKFRSPTMEDMASEEYQKQYPAENRSSQALASQVRVVNWSQDKRANIVRVAALSPEPQFAAQLVNVLCYCAGELMIRENQELSDGAVEWLHGQVEEKREALDLVEKEITEMRSSIQLDSLGQRKNALGEALNEITAEKSSVENQLASRKTIYEFVVELTDAKQSFEKLPTGLPKELEFQALVTVWKTAKNELVLSSDLYTEVHPEYQRLAREELRTRQQVEDFIDVTISAVKNEITLLERQFTQLNGRVLAMEDQAVALEQKLVGGEQQLQSLERRREAADDAYRGVLQRMEQARLSADEDTAFIKVIRDASIPGHPIRPDKLMVFIFGLFLGLLAGCGFAFLMEFWTDTVMLVSDLKELKLNILGIIPTQEKVESRGDLATIGLKDKFSHVFEIFCGINTLVSSDKYRDRTQVLLVCSVMPGEGKTISACNLAISAAVNNTRTLLIDGDLRRPRLATVFNIPEDHPTLLEWLSDEDEALDHKHLVTAGVFKNLDVITSRPSQKTNPAELMGRDKLRELFEWAREHYDRIIIDSPPSGLVGDTQALANQADSVIVVSRLGKTKKRGLKFVLGRFLELDANVLGCIANDVPHSLSGMFSGNYGYGYGSYGSYGGYGGYNSYGTSEESGVINRAKSYVSKLKPNNDEDEVEE